MSKKELLDPIGSLCKLVGLAFATKGTKICIKNHFIDIDKPTNYQGILRKYYGDGRENISELYDIIIRLILWFIVKDENDELSNSENYIESINLSNSFDEEGKIIKLENYNKLYQSDEIRELIEYLCISFENLQIITYNSGNVILSLQYYILILKLSLNNKFDKNMLPKNLEYEDLLDYNKLKNLWSIEEVREIKNLYDKCFKIYNVNKNEDNEIITGILNCIDKKLAKKNQEFQTLIKNSAI